MLQDNSRIKQLIHGAGDKIRSVLDSNEKLRLFSDRILLMIRMIRAKFSGAYTDFPWKTLVMIVGALIYFITPFDLIPDFIIRTRKGQLYFDLAKTADGAYESKVIATETYGKIDAVQMSALNGSIPIFNFR